MTTKTVTMIETMTREQEEAFLDQARKGLKQKQWIEPEGLTEIARGAVTLCWVHAELQKHYHQTNREGMLIRAKGWWREHYRNYTNLGINPFFLTELFRTIYDKD